MSMADTLHTADRSTHLMGVIMVKNTSSENQEAIWSEGEKNRKTFKVATLRSDVYIYIYTHIRMYVVELTKYPMMTPPAPIRMMIAKVIPAEGIVGVDQ